MPAPKPEEDAEALRLRLGGFSYEEIARRRGYRNRSGAFKAVERALNAGEAADVSALEVARLDLLQRSLMQKALGGDVPAALAVVKIIDQRAKLSGFYRAPEPAAAEPAAPEEKKGDPVDDIAVRIAARRAAAAAAAAASGS